MQKEKRYLTPVQFDKAIKAVIEKIKKSDFKPDIILGVMRGGMIPAIYASHLLGKIPVYAIRASEKEWGEFHIQKIVKDKLKKVQKILVVDEICDSGEVLLLLKKFFEEAYPKIEAKFAVVFSKKLCLNIIDYYSEVVDDKWLVFPYEKE